MRALLLTTDVGTLGGVQYAGRLFLRALRDWLGPEGKLTLVALKDKDLKLTDCRVYAGGGSRVRTGLTVLRLLRREEWDLMVLGHINLASLALSIGRARRPPLLAFVHGLEAWQPVRGLRRRGLLRADRLLYVSRYSQDRSQTANPWLRRLSSAICPLALLPEEACHAAAETSAGGPFALAIGRMAASERYKGYDELIRVWPVVQRTRPGLRLVLIGDGDDRPRLESLARDVGADAWFLGAVDNLTRDAYLAGCRCFCLPSRGEGLGLVYLEAMRAGKPVLTSSRDAGREVIVDRVTGRAVDPMDPNELLGGILDVSGERAELMGRAGQQRFHEQFAYDCFRERFARHITEVGTAGSLRN